MRASDGSFERSFQPWPVSNRYLLPNTLEYVSASKTITRTLFRRFGWIREFFSLSEIELKKCMKLTLARIARLSC